MTDTDKTAAIAAPSGRVAGAVLLAATALAMLAMAHHPVGYPGPQVAPGLSLGALVHGAMIVFTGVMLWAFAVFTLRRGLGGLALAGLVAFAIGAFGHVGAATISGFIAPALAARVDPAATQDLFVLVWQANQALARIGVLAASAAFLLWSLGLLRGAGAPNAALGVLGLAAALLPAGALLSGALEMNVGGAFLIYGLHALWTGIVGLQMLRRAL